MITCLILWIPAATTYVPLGPPVACPDGPAEEDGDEVQAASRPAASRPKPTAAARGRRTKLRRRMIPTIGAVHRNALSVACAILRRRRADPGAGVRKP